MQQIDVVDLKEPGASLTRDSSKKDFMKDFTKDSNASRRPSHPEGHLHQRTPHEECLHEGLPHEETWSRPIDNPQPIKIDHGRL